MLSEHLVCKPSVVQVAGVIIDHFPQASLGICRVSVRDWSPEQILVSTPASSQVAGVVTDHFPQASLGICRVSVRGWSPEQVLISTPASSQVAGVSSTQFPHVAQAVLLLTLDEEAVLSLDEDGSLLLLKTEDEDAFSKSEFFLIWLSCKATV